MRIKHTRIGELKVRLECGSERMLRYFDRDYREMQPEDAVEPNWIVRIAEGYGMAFQNYEVEVRRDGERMVYTRADYRVEVDAVLCKAWVEVYDELALKHAMTNLYSSLIVQMGWGLLLHSSCVVDGGNAVLFTGYSGAGKSTAARLSAPRELLSDEASILKVDAEGQQVTVFDSPFRSEIGSTNADRLGKGISLQAIHLLIQAPYHERKRLGQADAYMKLMDKVFLWPSEAKETTQALKLLKLVVEKVPVYELYFQKDNKFWELIVE